MPEEVKYTTKLYDYLKHQKSGENKNRWAVGTLCPFTLDKGREGTKKINQWRAQRQSLLCLTQRNAQTCQPEEPKHGIPLVRKYKISCHPGEDLDFVTSFQVSEKMSEFESILCKTVDVKIKDALFTDGLSFSFSKS